MLKSWLDIVERYFQLLEEVEEDYDVLLQPEDAASGTEEGGGDRFVGGAAPSGRSQASKVAVNTVTSGNRNNNTESTISSLPYAASDLIPPNENLLPWANAGSERTQEEVVDAQRPSPTSPHYSVLLRFAVDDTLVVVAHHHRDSHCGVASNSRGANGTFRNELNASTHTDGGAMDLQAGGATSSRVKIGDRLASIDGVNFLALSQFVEWEQREMRRRHEVAAAARQQRRDSTSAHERQQQNASHHDPHAIFDDHDDAALDDVATTHWVAVTRLDRLTQQVRKVIVPITVVGE